MGLARVINKLLKTLPFTKSFHRDYIQHKENSSFPAGHFYSPVVLLDDIRNEESEIFKSELPGGISNINLNESGQLQNLESFRNYYQQFPFKSNRQPGFRYYYNNEYYSFVDGVILYSIIRTLNPKNIIEIGSGFSSALMLDMNEKFNLNTSLTFIEPYPERLKSLLSSDDQKKVRIIEKKVQKVNTELYTSLEPNDILFVDSSHVAKTGSDLNFILFEILPLLKAGVLIHFHDIFYPFEYPKLWVMQGRNWNEIYFLRAFLMNNPDYKIEFFTSYMLKIHNDKMKDLPVAEKNEGGGIWLRKMN